MVLVRLEVADDVVVALLGPNAYREPCSAGA
jgi:hypothetical protein